MGQKIKTFFPKVVVSHIKLQEMEHGTPCTHIFCPYSHPRPLGLGQRVKLFFSEGSHVADQVKGNGAKRTTQAHILTLYTPWAPGVETKGHNIFF